MVKKLIQNLFLHSAKRTFFVVGGLITLIALPVTLFLSQQSQDIRQHASGCTYTFTSRGFLCVANEGSEGSTAPAVPANMSVTEGNINYYGTNGPIIELPNITNVPASNYVPPAPSRTQVEVTTDTSLVPKTSTSPSSAQNKCNNQNCCTTEDMNKGMICVKPAGVESCGCPTSWACEYIGRQNTDTSQTVRCVPPVGRGIAEGNACSPAGAQCAPTKVGNIYHTTECISTGPSYTCVRAVPTPSPTTSSGSVNTSSGGNTEIASEAGDRLTCDPVADGAINQLDYDLWLKEYTHQVNTTLTSCFVPGDSSVNILDFQVWKDITNNLIQDF